MIADNSDYWLCATGEDKGKDEDIDIRFETGIPGNDTIKIQIAFDIANPWPDSMETSGELTTADVDIALHYEYDSTVMGGVGRRRHLIIGYHVHLNEYECTCKINKYIRGFRAPDGAAIILEDILKCARL